MKKLMIAAMFAPLAGMAFAQTADISSYTELDDVRVIGSDGQRIGEIEEVLIDSTGMPAALVVEVEDGFLDLGDKEVVITMDALTWENGHYTTTMTPDEMNALPVWDD
ncbi:hypothetical protein OCGS_1713 [Oceaniovalibus guishaninsula JLT2003]|uniref:PRC-barrel domain-containing protein n=1 Tax=Oceaniovalibus guishaninsula JLT2003 TaxID=1231392 RepID=K2HC66_9RHOB|nr:PRC-barrel domain-containing protein [Oceaniovalibus guishaninsula]EKE44197.1 hypothetical protein OCGS_1713 [Oceaniovalibus guishaninsula JLT2003]